MIRSTHHSRGLANYRFNTLARELGHEHPAVAAAFGRLRYYRGDVPQRGSRTIQAIAWERESGRVPGYLNRRARRHARDKARAALQPCPIDAIALVRGAA